jgi:hypothetical protein
VKQSGKDIRRGSSIKTKVGWINIEDSFLGSINSAEISLNKVGIYSHLNREQSDWFLHVLYLNGETKGSGGNISYHN